MYLKPEFWLKSVLISWRHHFGTQVATLLVLSAAFVIIISFLSLVLNLNNIFTYWGKEVQVTAYLKDDLKEEQISQIKHTISELDEFDHIQYISKEEAKKSFKNQMDKYAPDLLDDPNFENPFPANFRMGLKSQQSLNHLENIANSVLKIEGVEDVSYGQDWVDNYMGLVKAFSRSTLFIALTLFFGSFFIISNTIRIALHQRREEMEIQELVGATPQAIRAPFVIDGIVLGGLASFLALIFSYSIYAWGKEMVGDNLAFLAISSQFQFLGFYWLLSTILFGSLIGGISSHLCVRRLKTTTNSLGDI